MSDDISLPVLSKKFIADHCICQGKCVFCGTTVTRKKIQVHLADCMANFQDVLANHLMARRLVLHNFIDLTDEDVIKELEKKRQESVVVIKELMEKPREEKEMIDLSHS